MTKPVAVVVYDLETTGQDPKVALPVQVAAVLELEGREPMIIMNCLANPGVLIEKGASEVHGIYDKDVHTAPPSEIVLFQLSSYIDALEKKYEVIIAGQNQISYDNTISERQGWPVNDYPQIDTLTLSRRLYPRLQNHKLETLYSMATGTELSGAHDASVDVNAVVQVMRFMLQEFDNSYEAMAEACSKPQAWEIMPIGKHKGKMTKEVPVGYWKYMLTNTNIGQDCPDFAETLKEHFTFLYEAHVETPNE